MQGRWIAGVIGWALLAPVAAAADLRAALDAAWARVALAPAIDARQAQADARERVAEAWFPRAPTAGFAYRRDLWTNPRGKRELEPELSLPLWAPGEREAARTLARTERGALEPAAMVLRLRVAAQVREAAWALAIAQADADGAGVRLEAARALEEDVARQERAGALARADLLMVQAEAIDARGAQVQAQAALAAAVHDWRTLTGMAPLVPAPESPAATRASGSAATAPSPIDTHPELRDRAARVAVAMAQLAQSREVRRDGLELSVAMRHDRDSSGLPDRDTIRFGIRIPLDTEARNAPRIAAASVSLAEAEAELVRARQRLDAEQHRAAEAERAATIRRTLATERRRVAEESHDLVERAFRAGERPLADLLRARLLREDARLEERRTQARFGLARARLNQSLGVMP